MYVGSITQAQLIGLSEGCKMGKTAAYDGHHIHVPYSGNNISVVHWRHSNCVLIIYHTEAPIYI